MAGTKNKNDIENDSPNKDTFILTDTDIWDTDDIPASPPTQAIETEVVDDNQSPKNDENINASNDSATIVSPPNTEQPKTMSPESSCDELSSPMAINKTHIKPLPLSKLDFGNYKFVNVSLSFETETSRIYKVEEKNKLYFLKVYNIVFDGKDIDAEIANIKKIINLKNTNIVKVYDVWQSQGHIYILMKYFKNLTLKYNFDTQSKVINHFDFLINFFIPQASSIIETLHENKFLHIDASLDSFFLSDDCESILFNNFESLLFTSENNLVVEDEKIYYPLAYKSPESVFHTYSEKSDYYALGITLSHLYSLTLWTDLIIGKTLSEDYLKYIIATGEVLDLFTNAWARQANRNHKIEDIIANLVVKERYRWTNFEISRFLKDEPIDVSINFDILGNGKISRTKQDIYNLITRSAKNWDDFRVLVQGVLPNHYLECCFKDHSRVTLNKLAAESIAKKESIDLLIFKTLYTLYPQSTIAFRSFQSNGNILQLTENLMEDIIKNPNSDLIGFISSGAFTYWLDNTIELSEVAKTVKKLGAIDSVASLVKLAYTLNPNVPLKLWVENDPKSAVVIKNLADFRTITTKLIGENYIEEDKITDLPILRLLHSYINNGIIEQFLTNIKVSQNYINLFANIREKYAHSFNEAMAKIYYCFDQNPFIIIGSKKYNSAQNIFTDILKGIISSDTLKILSKRTYFQEWCHADKNPRKS